MSDSIDDANHVAELNLAASLRFRKPTLTPCGVCYYCDEHVRSGVLFCEAACRDDWQAEERVRRIGGKR